MLTTIVDEQQKNGLVSLTRKDVLKAIMSTPVTSELRFQGVDFVGADLSKLDLRNINFKVIEIIFVSWIFLTEFHMVIISSSMQSCVAAGW